MARRKTSLPGLRFRQIHLDFHTSPLIPEIGKKFDARVFARTMADAHVDSVTVFAKCHHGHLYYNTDHPARHPHLAKGLDLLAEQVQALHAAGIRAPIYLSVQCDEYAANTHPEWVATRPDTGQVKWGGSSFVAGWQILDMSSPYQDYVAEQLTEILQRFDPVDGVFFDMCWDQPSCSKWAVAGMRAAELDPEIEADRAIYANRVTQQYMKRFHAMVKKANREASVYFNGRPYHALPEDAAYQTQVEIEALPTGGWGYMFFPKNVRFARNFGLPYMGMTARFHKSWADFGGIKPYAGLEYETSQMMAHGARCSIGDQMHPLGTLEPAVYELIGRVYKRVKDREPWLVGAEAVSQIGLFNLPASFSTHGSVSGTDEGAVRMLTQLRQQFDVISADSDLGRYELLILPDTLRVDETLARKISAYIKKGGKLLATGTAGLSEDGKKVLVKELPIRAEGMSPFTTTYMRFGKEINQGVPAMDHVMYERGVRVKAVRGAKVLAQVVEPYFERAWDHFSSHFQTPPERVSDYPAVVEKGGVAYIAHPVFIAFARHGNAAYRWLLGNTLNRILPDPLIRAEGPTGMEVTVARQGRQTIVHLLHYSPERRTPQLDLLEDVVPLYDVEMSVLLGKKPGRAYVAPSGEEIAVMYEKGRANVVVPEVNGHAMVVFE
ncbi:MAG TPA: beta-galactosidase trimerization domain-containing protein [Tepidisphaeraceae bacterium]|nr:beta-galactosidase trimerization domain-containing protein [Tepidisphaeraceae bacterium]